MTSVKLALAPLVSPLARVHVTALATAAQVKPSPEPDTKVRAEGSWSLTTIGSVEASVPEFATVKFQAATRVVVLALAKVFVIPRSNDRVT